MYMQTTALLSVSAIVGGVSGFGYAAVVAVGEGLSGWWEEGGVGSPLGRIAIESAIVGKVDLDAVKSGADNALLWLLECNRD